MRNQAKCFFILKSSSVSVPLLLLSFCRAAAEPLPLQPDYNTQTTRSRGEIWQLPRGATPAIVGANLENVLAKV